MFIIDIFLTGIKWGSQAFIALLVFHLIEGIFTSIIPSKYIKSDNTDAPGRNSGLYLRTDNLTGVQYLQGWFGLGNLTPRLNKDGNLVTIETEKPE